MLRARNVRRATFPRRCAALLVGLMSLSIACRQSDTDAADIRIDVTLTTSPPRVGASGIEIGLSNGRGEPVSGAVVQVEGNMNHAGMRPSFASLTESSPGRHSGSIEFTMGGDWFLIVEARLPDGRRARRQIDVPGVQTR